MEVNLESLININFRCGNGNFGGFFGTGEIKNGVIGNWGQDGLSGNKGIDGTVLYKNILVILTS
jgi:hypothetical protein